MPYPALPASRRRHYEIDGVVAGYNTSGFGSGLVTVFTAADLVHLNGETPSVDVNVTPNFRGGNQYIYFLFPELLDLSYFVLREINSASNNSTMAAIQGSADTTNGADGTWTTIGTSGTLIQTQGVTATDWWRSITPASLTTNNTGLKALRFNIRNSGLAGSNNVRNIYLWGHKHAGETPDDIIFLESDNATEWPNDDDWGDLNAGVAAVTHQYYVKNTSATKTANSVTVKSSGSDNAQWDVSLDNVSFASSQSVGNLAPGASQVVYFRFTPPSPAAGVYRPYATYLEADIASWT